MALVFNRHVNLLELEEVVGQFKTGGTVEVGEAMPARAYVRLLDEVPGLRPTVTALRAGDDPALIAGAVEFILEGLHLNKRLNKDRIVGRVQYRG